jgi:hypothetical protein
MDWFGKCLPDINSFGEREQKNRYRNAKIAQNSRITDMKGRANARQDVAEKQLYKQRQPFRQALMLQLPLSFLFKVNLY